MVDPLAVRRLEGERGYGPDEAGGRSWPGRCKTGFHGPASGARSFPAGVAAGDAIGPASAVGPVEGAVRGAGFGVGMVTVTFGLARDVDTPESTGVTVIGGAGASGVEAGLLAARTNVLVAV